VPQHRTAPSSSWLNVCDDLDVADGHCAQRPFHESEEMVDIGAVGALGVLAAAMEPAAPAANDPFRLKNYVEQTSSKPDQRNVREADLSGALVIVWITHA
jgi:hypothetical protein